MKGVGQKISYGLSLTTNIIREYGYELKPESLILDFGCGSGKMVKELCNLGYQAYGCGTRFNEEETVDTALMLKKGILREIDLKNYRLPFEDNTFDIIYSHSVFEHVQNYSESISEIARVLKPKGCCLHFFTSRYNPIEPHTFVPFSSVIQTHGWLYFWALVGVRNEWQDCRSAKERANRYFNYLKEETNYLSKRQLTEQFGRQFKDVIYCDNLFNKYSPRRRKVIYPIAKVLPVINSLHSTFNTRIIFTRSPYKYN